MSTIRRQSIISSIVIYIGFAVGLLNMYLFTSKQGDFQDSQYGLYNAFIAISLLMMAVSNLAMPAYIYKFYPYYNSHLPQKKNDLLTVAIITSLVGFILVVIAGTVFKGLVVRKYSGNSPEIVMYYNWIFVLGFGYMLFSILEAYAWQLHKSIVTNFLKEVQWRLYTTVLIILFSIGVISDFDLFIKLFSFSFPFIALVLLVYLVVTKKIHFTFKISRVTKRFSKQILKLCSFIYASSLIFTIAQVFDSLLISSVLKNALQKLAIYSAVQNITNLIQVPQRAIIAASIPHLSTAWKEKDLGKIQRIYQRSSINQLIFSCGLYALVTINFIDAVNTFQLKESYLDGFYLFLFLGAVKIVDMGTGVNAQIIGTSTYWKFEMLSGVVLLCVMLPTTYFLTLEYDIIGPGISGLISIIVYNTIRIIFLWKKFRLFPFSVKTLYTLCWAGICFAACYFGFREMSGWLGLVLRSVAFCIIYAGGAILLKLSPDIKPVLETARKRLRF